MLGFTGATPARQLPAAQAVLAALPITIILTVLLHSSPLLAAPDAAPAAIIPPSTTQERLAQTIVASMVIQGKQPWQRLRVADMDIIPPASEKGPRLLPLGRFLKAMDVSYTEDAGVLRFNAEEGGAVELSTVNGTLSIAGSVRSIEMIQGTSLITQTTQVYVPEPLLAEWFVLDFEWNERDFELLVRTQKVLKPWRDESGKAVRSTPIRDVPTDLPELLPEAQPPRFSLDFLELQARARITALDQQATNQQDLFLDSFEQTLWGSLWTGRYKLHLSQSPVLIDRDGAEVLDDWPFQIKWADLTFRNENHELALGDSSYGVSDLIMPFLRLTGVRFNGLFGTEGLSLERDGSGLGLRQYFLQPQVFEGFAPVGSTVEIFVNDRRIDSTEVLADTPGAPPGQGIWRFDDVRLPAGTRNEVRIVVTDPTGIRTQTQRAILGSSRLMPPGTLALLAGMGTRRDIAEWSFHGVAAAGRVLAGLTDRFTLGASAAVQQGVNRESSSSSLLDDVRQIPSRSFHVGTQFAYQPVDTVQINADLALAGGEEADENSQTFLDVASRLMADFTPAAELSLHGAAFYYGPTYFNGVSDAPRDRTGATAGFTWRPVRGWTVAGSTGTVVNNLDARLDQTINAHFQTLRVSAAVLPRASTIIEFSRIDADGQDHQLLTFELSAALPWDLALTTVVSLGDELTVDKDSEFFSGLNVPDLPLFESPQKHIVLRRAIESGHSIGLAYQETTTRQRTSLLHDLRLYTIPRLVFHTEIGVDMDTQQLFIDNRSDWLLDRSGSTRVGLQARLERDVWQIMVVFTLDELFSPRPDGSLARITEKSINPDSGVVRGLAFLDVNANGQLDPDETGLANLTVATPGGYSDKTDSRGYYILQAGSRPRKDRVYLNVKTAPADLSPTHAIQNARVAPRSATTVNLGLCPLHAVVGEVILADATGAVPVPGVHVFITSDTGGAVITDSFTANDGSFYLGNLRPGNYLITIDPASLTRGLKPRHDSVRIHVPSASHTQELRPGPIELVRAASADAGPAGHVTQ